MNKLKKIWIWYIQAGLGANPTEEDIRKVSLLNSMNLVGFSFVTLFGLVSLLESQYSHGTILMGISCVVILNFVALKATCRYLLGTWVVLLLMFFLLLYLLISGGVSGSGLLWFYVFPLLAMFLLGPQLGTLISLSLLGIAAFLLYAPVSADLIIEYPEALKSRFLASNIAVITMSFFYETNRFRSYTSLVKLTEKFELLSQTDPLTGLFNRRGVIPLLEKQYFNAYRYKRKFSLALIDIDHFKRINDTFGHDCGDHVIKEVAQNIQGSLRRQDTLARWGGEEFLVVLPDTDKKGCRTCCTRILHSVASTTLQWNEHEIRVTISIGSYTSEEIPDVADIIKEADKNMYAAKKQGRNRYVCPD